MVRVVEVTAETLGGIAIFRSLPSLDRGKIARHCRGRCYARGREILHYRDNTSDVYFVLSGMVRATIFASSGKEIAFRDLGCGEMFGHLSAIDGRRRCASVVTRVESIVLSMTAKHFRNVIHQHASVTDGVLLELSKLIRMLTERVVEFSTLPVGNRLRTELLRLAADNMHGKRLAEIKSLPTHADLASRLSTHREAVTRELSRLEGIGVIERRSGSLVVPNVPRLARMVEEASAT